MAVAAVICLAGLPSRAEFSYEFLAGSAWNRSSPLLIQQTGEPDLRIDAAFSTRGFEIPMYWIMRLTWWRGRIGWALDLNHHKLHIEDPPPQIERFTVSHGYNHLSLQMLGRWRWFHALMGFGVVIAHPENIVRGQVFPETGGFLREGEYIGGPLLVLGGGGRMSLSGPLFATLETRMTASSIDAPVERGDFSLRHLALHGALGLGLRF